MSEKKVPADGKWYRATWPGTSVDPEWSAVIEHRPGYEPDCYGFNADDCGPATVIAIDRHGEAYACCENCRPGIAEEEGA